MNALQPGTRVHGPGRPTGLSGWRGLFALCVLAACWDAAVAQPPAPAFLIVQWDDSVRHGALDPAQLGAALQASAGEVVAAADGGAVLVLEPGSPPLTTMVLRWPSRSALAASWDRLSALLPRGTGTLVLAVDGLPATGLGPEASLPNVANVPRVESSGPPAFMLVQGSVSDLAAMPAYRALIQPMLVERGAYYVVYAAAAEVEVLQGRWEEQALIVSRWPDSGKANDFWYSEIYQRQAVPARAAASRFTVLLLAGGCEGELIIHICEP